VAAMRKAWIEQDRMEWQTKAAKKSQR